MQITEQEFEHPELRFLKRFPNGDFEDFVKSNYNEILTKDKGVFFSDYENMNEAQRLNTLLFRCRKYYNDTNLPKNIKWRKVLICGLLKQGGNKFTNQRTTFVSSQITLFEAMNGYVQSIIKPASILSGDFIPLFEFYAGVKFSYTCTLGNLYNFEVVEKDGVLIAVSDLRINDIKSVNAFKFKDNAVNLASFLLNCGDLARITID